MTRFLNYLNREIKNVMKLQNNIELDDMVCMTIKVEQNSREKEIQS